MKHSVFIALSTFLLMISCSVDKADDNPTPQSFCDTISFNNHILPIFTSICANPACHVIGGAGPFALTNYSEISAMTDQIIPAIQHTGSIKMPYDPSTFTPAEKLPQVKIETIKCWVAAGKPNN